MSRERERIFETRRRECLAAALTGMLVAAVCIATPGAARAFDHALFAELLESHTRSVRDTAGTRVDYRGLLDSPKWRALIKSLEHSDIKALATQEQKFAFWINAYNILAIEAVLRAYPVESIRDIGSFVWPVWKRKAGLVGGQMVTLAQVEHEILRPMGDPRVHAALVCASVSCPSLRREPWQAERLEAQFEDTIARWLANREKGARLDRAHNRIYVSKIFDWFEEDFDGQGGVLSFVSSQLLPTQQQWIEANRSKIDIKYLDYDWGLNDLAPRE